jgi:hypothetical protein
LSPSRKRETPRADAYDNASMAVGLRSLTVAVNPVAATLLMLFALGLGPYDAPWRVFFGLAAFGAALGAVTSVVKLRRLLQRGH